MPSKDNFRARQDANLGLAAPERPRETVKRAGRAMNAQILRLARRTGTDPDELAAKIPPDTMRRLGYPVLEGVDEDGRRTFKHDPLIVEGRSASTRP